MRAISASGTLASVTAGSSICRRLAPIIVALPDSRLSITLMPVIRGGSSPTGISPPTGSQPRPAANSTSSIRPSQKIGIDTPNRVSVITTASKRDPCRIAASTPTGTPHRLASSSDASASCSVTGNAGQHVVQRRAVALDRDAEVAAQRVEHEAAVLHPHRLIQPKLLAQPLQLLVGCVVAQQQLRDIARQQMHGDEHHDADADQHEQELDQAGSDVACHSHRLRCVCAGSSRSPARGRVPHAACRSTCGWGMASSVPSARR